MHDEYVYLMVAEKLKRWIFSLRYPPYVAESSVSKGQGT